MKKLIVYRLIRFIATCHVISSLLVFLVLEINGVYGKSPTKTKLLLQNIRTHLTQKADEIVKEKECGFDLILCKKPKSKKEEEEEEEEEERSEKISFPSKFWKAQHKALIKVKKKPVIQTLQKEVKDESGENVYVKDKLAFKETKQSWDIPKNLLKDKQKYLTLADAESPKVESGKLKDVSFPSLKRSKKTLKKTPKLEQEEVATKISQTWMKEKREAKYKKGRRQAEAKSDEQRPPKEAFAFPYEPFVFLPLSDSAQRNACRKHSQIYLKHLQRHEIWALMMYDASAKLASGILRGNTNQYGDFDECLSISVLLKKSKDALKSSWRIEGKYCLANIDLKSGSENISLRRVQDRVESFRFIKSTIHDPGHFIPRFSTINWGLCVPSSCLAEDVEKFLKYQFGFINNSTEFTFDIKVNEENCVVKDDLKFKFNAQTTMTALLYLAVLSLSLYATYFDEKVEKPKISRNENFERELEEAERNLTREDGRQQVSEKNDAGSSKKGKGRSIVAAFSLKKNMEKLFTDKNRGGIECINGIKALFTILLYFAHKTIPLAMTPFSNRVALTKLSNQPITVVLRASIVYTDSFLLISGMLTAYGLSAEMLRKKEISWIKKSIGRFIRLTPPLLAVVLFYAYFWDHLGSGPIWNLIVRKNSSLCRQYLWRNLFYIQNLFDFENMCAPQTHQLALDMQLSLLAPFLVHLMHKHDKIGIGILQALFILSSIMRYITTFNNNLSVVIYHGMPVTQLYKTANLLYTQALHRASPYILGTVVGYHLKKFENQLHLPKAFAALGWVMALSFGYYSLTSPSRLASRNYQYNAQEAAQYAALSPVAWSLALSWVIAACHLGFGGKLNKFLCHKIFLVFSRISYSVYLTQFLVFFYRIGVKKNPEIFTLASSFSITEFAIIIFGSVIVTLLFDLPTIEIKKIILDDKSTEVFIDESNDSSETLPQKEKGDSEIIPSENLQKKEEDLSEGTEGDGGSEEDMADVREENDESTDEETSSGNEMIEAVFEIRPLKRSSKMRFRDEFEDEELERRVGNK